MTREEKPAPSHAVRVSLMSYNATEMEAQQNVGVEGLGRLRDQPTISWINIDGVHDGDLIAALGREFDLHPLVLEDIMNTSERPKLENYGDYLYFVMSMADLDSKKEIRTEQVSIVLGRNFILSFQEDPDDIFNPIRHQLANPASKVRKMGSDYLAYLLLDAVVDRYFLLLEIMAEKIDALEEELMEKAAKNTLKKIYDLKRELIHLRRSVWPMREIVGNMQREESALLSDDLSLFLRDFYDHIMRIIDSVETYRDTMSSMVDLYLSNSSIRMNEIMQVLTVISTIFIPLTFITGFYGMNFDFMPEVHSRWSYPAVVIVMVVMVVVQLIYFRKKKWL